MAKGIVVGKFYPYHRGHKYLIDFALKNSDYLVVMVCERKDQIISGAVRLKWIKESHPKAKVMVIQDILKDDDSKAWAEYTIKLLGYKPDIVFSSEDYGDDYAKHMGAKHIKVDKKRVKVPISATQIRSLPQNYWKFLEPSVRGYFAKRVCLLGAESTGTTTLSRDLASHYKTTWVPELGRTYWEGKMQGSWNKKWRTDEFVFIAKEQNRFEDFLAKDCNKILFCDTNSFATHLWHKRYLGFYSDHVKKTSSNRKYDFYFLTDTDIPFVQDGTRDGEHIRERMHLEFIRELKKRNFPYLIVSGSRKERLEKAVGVCDILINQNDRQFDNHLTL